MRNSFSLTFAHEATVKFHSSIASSIDIVLEPPVRRVNVNEPIHGIISIAWIVREGNYPAMMVRDGSDARQGRLSRPRNRATHAWSDIFASHEFSGVARARFITDNDGS